MQFVLKMPKLSPTMEEGTIAKWHKKEGDFVSSGDLILEIATDKATIEHNALDEGWLRKILTQEGQAVNISAPIAIFTTEKEEAIQEPEKPVEAPPQQPPAGTPPEMAEKAPAPKVATPASQPLFVPEPPLEAIPSSSLPSGSEERIFATPLAKRLAKEQGLDLSTVRGTGPGGRITSHDLAHAQPKGLVAFGRREAPKEVPGSYEEIPLSPIRKIISKRLQESKSFIPHFYVKQVIDATPLYNLREELKRLDLKVTFNDLIIRAAALALRKHPEVNSGFNSANQTLVRFKTIDISIAVTVESGLITPIIRHADFKNLGELSIEMRLLAEKARKGKLKEHEYKGGSFCISNLGMFGVTEFAAIINPPQSAILAIGGIEERPVIKEGCVVPGKTLALTLSVDHRVIDGALAAQFIKTVQLLLENPAALTIM